MSHDHVRHGLTILAALVVVFAFINLLSGGRNLALAAVTAAVVIVLFILEVRLYRPRGR